MVAVQYGQEVLEKVSQPSYSFTVDSADFLVMEEFEAFKNALSLGKRVYIKLDDGRVLTPLLLGFSHAFDEESSLTLEFSSKFTSNDENDRLVDLLEQSVSMGKKLGLNREINAFTQSHANTAIHDFMNGALDVAKNSILSTTGQAISWDENGLRLRKWNSDRTGYEDEQIWMKDNLIVFTEDAWQHAKMAIGHIHDEELGDLWGVVADNLVGKMIAGENVYINSTKPDGEHMSFTVDGVGMRSWNAHQVWEKDNWGIAIDPDYGLFMNDGTNPLYKTVGDKQVPWCCNNDGSLRLKKDSMGDTYSYPDGANIWIGLDGNAYFRGNIYATNGVFNGIVKAQDFQLPSGDSMVSILNSDKKIKSDWLDLMGINIKNNAGQTVMTIDQTGVKFGSTFSPIKTKYSTNKEATIPGGWSDTWNSSWNGTSTEVWAIYSYDSGTTWTTPMLAQGKTGAKGSDANVTRANIENALKKASTISESYIGVDSMGAPEIYGGNIYGSNIYAGHGKTTYAHIGASDVGTGFYVYMDGNLKPKISLEEIIDGRFVQLVLGSGSNNIDNTSGRLFVTKGETGASIQYFSASGEECGFSFKDGVITPIGQMKIKAVFG